MSEQIDAQTLLETVVAAKLSQAAPALRSWYAGDQLRANFQEALQGEVERAFSDELARDFRKYCPVPGVKSDEAYKNRWLKVSDGHALVGIRFKGLDLARPFVTVAATTWPVESAEDISRLTEFLKHEYAPFAPLHVRLFVPAGVPIDVNALPPGSEWEKRFLAAPVADLLARPRPENYERVALRAPENLDFSPRYAAEYEVLFKMHPEHREFARVENEEDLSAYREEGLLFEVLIGGEWAGVVAATRAEEEGLKGFVVVEMFLDAAHRGRGLGPAVQRHLTERLPAQAGDVLYGTIHDRNRAAVGAARRSERQDIGAYLWVSV